MSDSKLRTTASGRLRHILDHVVFPLATPSPSPRRFGLIAALGFITGTAYLTFIPAGWSRAQRLWAEDSTLWLGEPALGTPLTSLLIEPYGGYFHTIPRLIGAGVAWTTPVDGWAAAMFFASSMVRVALAVMIFAAARSHVPAVSTRLVVASAMVWLPAANWETLGNATNLHWFLFFALFWALLWRPSSRWGAAGVTVLVLALSLSVPLAVALVPLAVGRVMLPRWRDRLPAIAILGAAVATTMTLLTASRPHDELDVFPWLLSGAARGPLAALVGPQAVWTLAVHRTDLLIVASVVAVAVITGVSVAGLLWGTGRERVVVGHLYVIGMVIGYLSLYSNWAMGLAVSEGSFRIPRYSTAAALFLLAAVAVGLGVIARHARSVGTAGIVACAVVVCAGTLYQLSFGADRLGTPVLGGVTWSESVGDARVICRSVAPPDSVRITTLPTEEWFVDVPCSRLVSPWAGD